MKDSIVQLINMVGIPILYSEVSYIDKLLNVYSDKLLKIGTKKLYDFQTNLDHVHDCQLEKFRFVIANTVGERQILMMVQPVKIYLSDHSMNSKKIEVNPYQSVRWLKSKVQTERKSKVKLIINEQQLPQNGDSLLRYIHENAIIHILSQQPSHHQIQKLHIKQPNYQTKQYILQNIQRQSDISFLTKKISQLTSIPQQFLYLIYGGKMLPKDRKVWEYHLENNGRIYAVDSRKYMKPVTLSQYQKRVNQIRKVSKNNTEIFQKVKEEKQKQKEKPQKLQKENQQQKKVSEKSIQEQLKNYFESVNNSTTNKVKHHEVVNKERVESNNQINQEQPNVTERYSSGLISPPNTPFIKQSNFDWQNFDENQGLKIQQTEVTTSQTRDKDGNVVKTQTDIFTAGTGLNCSIKKEHNQVKEGEKVTHVDNQVVKDLKGEPVKIQTNISEKKEDEQGNVHEYSKDIKEEGGVTTVIQVNVVHSKDGAFLQSNTDIIKIATDEDGNIRKHEHNEIEKDSKKVIIQREVVSSQSGEIISTETDVRTVSADNQKQALQHKTDIIEGDDIKTTLIEKNIIEDLQDNIIKQEIDKICHPIDQNQQLQQNQENTHHLQNVITFGEEQPLINGDKEVSVDQLGNTHTHQTQMVQKQGKTTFVDKSTIEDPLGKVIRVQTERVVIQGDDQGNMHEHKSQLVEEQNRLVIVQTDVIKNPDGIAFRQQTDTVEIDCGIDGSILKHERDVIQQQGKTKIIQKDIIKDAQGNIIHSQTKITQIQDTPDAINVHQTKQQIVAVQDNQEEQNGIQQVHKQVQVMQDQHGNTFTKEKEVIENQQGDQTIVYRNVVQNEEGELIKQQQQTIRVSNEGEHQQVHRHIVDYTQQQNKITLQKSTMRENMDGQIITSKKQIVQIQQCQDGSVLKTTTDVIESEGKTIVYTTNTIENAPKELLRQQSDTHMLEDANVSKKTMVDEEGNLHLMESQVTNQGGHQKFIQRQVISNPHGDLIKTQTGILQTQHGEDGNTRFTATDIIEEGSILTVTKSDTFNDSMGNQLKKVAQKVTIQDIGNGLTKKHQQNIVDEGDVNVRVQKQVLQDGKGNILSQNTTKTQLRFALDENNNQVISQSIQRKAMQVLSDSQGHIHYKQSQMLDTTNGNKTIIQTQLVKTQSGQILKATTDVLQLQKKQSGTQLIYQTNIIQDQNKITVIENQSVSNKQGQILTNKTQIVQLIPDQFGNMKKILTNVVEKENSTIITEKTAIQSEDGTIINPALNVTKILQKQNGNIQIIQNFQPLDEDGVRKQKQPKIDQHQKNVKEIQMVPIQHPQQSISHPELPPQHPQIPTTTNTRQSQRKSEQMNLLDTSLKSQEQKTIKQLPLQSKKQLKQKIKFKRQSTDKAQLIIPQQYNIVTISKQRIKTPIQVRYDDLIDEVTEKLSNVIGKQKQKIKFYKNGKQLKQNQLVANLQIQPDSQLYFLVQEDNLIEQGKQQKQHYHKNLQQLQQVNTSQQHNVEGEFINFE